MQPLSIPNGYTWSQRRPGMPFNSHLFVLPDGNVAIDPVALEPDEEAEVAALGGIAWIVLTNSNHVRHTVALCKRFGAKVAARSAEIEELGAPVDRVLSDGDALFPGAAIVWLENQNSSDEIAISFPEYETVLVGDALFGTPAGAVSLPPDDLLEDVRLASMGVRTLLALQPQTLLLGHGSALYSGATRAIAKLVFERLGIAANRINLDDLRSRAFSNGKFFGDRSEVGFYIGAERLGYQVVTLPPGARYCPLHAEFFEEEVFFVLEGEPSIRTEHETLPCRKGDFIAFPIGRRHAHQVLNESGADATLLLLGESQPSSFVYYPESDKLLAYTPEVCYRVRNAPQLDYYEGE
jgi:uncharacterized cupin superfamily protein